MKLVEEANGYKLYDLENGYFVTKENCSWNCIGFRLSIHSENNYLPDIYVKYDKEISYKIQTTSYGALVPEEIAKVIEGYHVALQTVEIVKSLSRKN